MPTLLLEELPPAWRKVLEWGPCFCVALDGRACPSCDKSAHLEASGLDWATEYGRAIDAGEAVQL